MKFKELLKVINASQCLVVSLITPTNNKIADFVGLTSTRKFYYYQLFHADDTVDHIAVTADACLKIYLKIPE